MKNGWQTKTLGDVAKIRAGNSAPQDKSLFKDGKYPFFRTADAGRVRFGYIRESTDYLKEKGIQGLRRFPKGTILFPKSGASTFLNHRVILGVEGYVSSHLATIVADETKIKPRFLLYYLSTVAAQDLVQDHAYPSLNLPTIAGIIIHVPSIPEQRRIVGILDEAFEGIATAKANAEKNLQNARALFESHLNAVFTRRGKGWVEKRLGDIAQVRGGKRVPKGYKLLNEPTDFPYLRVSEFTASGTIDTSDLRYVSPEIHRQIKNYVIYSTDLYISIAGTIGKTGIIPEELDGANLTENACRLVFNPGVINRFVYYFTVTLDFVEQAGLNTRTAAQPKLALSRLASIKLGIPPLAKQKRLAAEFDTLHEKTQRLESIYQQKLAKLEELKKSLLHQAFTGKL